MKRLAWTLCCAVLRAFGGELPDPLFVDSPQAFLDRFIEGQFDPLLEAHLVQYSADPAWVLDWAGQRYRDNGVLVQAGSISSRDLFLDSALALNLFPGSAAQVRYDRRRYDDGRFEQDDERFDLLWHSGAGWGLALAGTPEPRKREALLGAGFRLGPARSSNALEVRLLGERWLWNQKTDDNLRYTRAPVRLLVDGSLATTAGRLGATLDLGQPYRAETAGAPAAARAAWGRRRSLELVGGWWRAPWEAGLRLSARSQDRGQADPAAVMESNRTWVRLLAQVRRPIGNYSAHGVAGLSTQTDRFSVPGVRAGTYHMRAALLGLEAGRPLTPAFQLRLGLLGSRVRMERRVLAVPGEPGALVAPPDRDEHPWVGKAHLRALFGQGPSWGVEALLSQTLGGERFGGASVKARFVF